MKLVTAQILIALAAWSVCGLAAAQTTVPAESQQSESVNEQNDAMITSAWDLETRAERTKSVADYRAAAAALQTCSDALPKDLNLERTLGWIYLEKLNEPKQAYPHLNYAYSTDPTDPGWGLMLAKAAGLLADTDQQFQILHDLVQRNPKDGEVYLELAKALDHVGHTSEAEKAYEQADEYAGDEDWIRLEHAQFLHDHGHDAEALRIAKAVLAKDPKSAQALVLLGDIHRANYDLTEARDEYARAMQFDPTFTTAKEGLSDIAQNQAPQFQSDYYYFDGSDHFHQMGLFNTLIVPVSDHLAINASYNNGYFTNNQTSFASVVRYQENLGIEDRFSSDLSFRGGVDAFQQPSRQVTGFNVGATWKPNEHFWVDGTFRLNDPVNDTMFTVANALSQNVLAVSSGYQFNDRLGAKVIATAAEYSDNNTREFLHAEPFYELYFPAQLRIGVAYESTWYTKNTQYSSASDYQTIGPVIHAEPAINSWLSIQMNLYPLLVIDPARAGVEVTVGPAIHLANRFQLSVEYSYYSLPESTVGYSGNGVSATLSYRF